MASTPERYPSVNDIPAFGLGTWENEDPDQCADSVATAIEAGYRHIDTAQIYGNEAAVGAGIARADVPREELFVATKVWIDQLNHDDVIASTEESLEKLGLDHVELLYVHWPADAYDPADTLPAFETLRERGLIDRIGVSNFEPRHLDRAREVLDAPIAANQVECHPLLPQEELRAYADTHDHALVAYSPLARGAVLEDPTIQAVAERNDATPAQVSLAWLLEKGAVPIPKATSGAHIKENIGALECALSAEDIAEIDAIDRRSRQVDPDFAPW